MNTLTRLLRNTLKLVAVVAFGIGLGSSAMAASEKGAERLMSLTKVSTYGDLENLKAGDKFVMVCAKCQTVMMHTVSKSKGRDIPTMTAQHKCTGCNSTITTVGHGKAKTDKVTHSCSGCGDGSVFCCSTSKDGKKTTGMEKH
ncbi:MAG: hypothetical protein JNN01_09820 [Opitutaceae bacterium]|nr:hypothetical protein [Opitutaceae bacterium]